MKLTKLFVMALGVAGVMTACSSYNDDDPTGSWTSSAPESVTEAVAGAKTATVVTSIDFNKPVGDADGMLTLVADYDVTAPVVTDSATTDVAYKVVATIKGTWAQDGDDHDDYLLTFDKNTLSVEGTDAPELGPVTDAFLNSLSKFSVIEDVEVSKDKKHLTFETKNPEVKYHYVSK